MARKRSWSASLTNFFSSSSSAPKDDKPPSRLRSRRGTISSLADLVQSQPTPTAESPSALPSQTRTNTRISMARPLSMLHTYSPPTVEITKDELPELQPIFNYLNTHSAKLYTEGYFLKLVDLTPDGKPPHDRSWKECFGQLRGTVLSMWDAAALDDAEYTGAEVVPTFLNLADASIKMIDKLPTRSPNVPPLTNVLSISTAGRNRYLFHCNSHHSLAQWTASIRLCMFEHSKLQEIYTGAIIAAKGKELNGIKQITERTKFQYEEWVRVRFGAGTPWRKCWAVITQPDEKSRKKAKAAAKKAKKTSFPTLPVLRGDIKFYDNKKIKKQQPIATLTGCFAAYAVYPQSRPLIDQSTLIKMEGKVRIHGEKPTETEGFVFVMPEIHPMVSGFETMLRFLFPAWDTFALYGRPGMLIPDKTDPRGLMFAMPRDNGKDCGYLDVVDVVTVVVQEGLKIKLESEWREKLKELSKERIDKQPLIRGHSRSRSSLPALGRAGQVLFKNGTFKSTTSLPIAESDLPPQHVPMQTPPASSHRDKPSRPVSDMSFGRLQRPGTPQFSQKDSRNSMYSQDNPPNTGSSQESNGYFPGRVDPAAAHFQHQTLQPVPDPVPVTPRTTHAPNARPPQNLPRTPGAAGPPGEPAFQEDNLFAGVVPSRRRAEEEEYEERYNERTNAHMAYRGPPPGRGQGREYREDGDSYHEQPTRQNRNTFGGANQNGARYSFEDERKPPLPVDTEAVRQHQESSEAGNARPPSPAESFVSLQAHLLQEGVLNHIYRSGSVRAQTYDEDVLDRRARDRVHRVASGNWAQQSDSEYDDEDDVPDYASIDSEPPKVVRDLNQPRAGRKKVVGSGEVTEKPDVTVGDAHYRPGSRNALDEPLDIPAVDFGTTVLHGRSLSGDLDLGRASSRGGFSEQPLSSRAPSRLDRPSPDVSDTERNTPRRRSFLWHPGVGQIGGQEGMVTSPEEYVAERAAAAQADTRQRFIHHRKSSSQMLLSGSVSGSPSPNRNSSNEHLPPRPHSRGGMAAFSTPDLTLSAKQQEYAARKTGTAFLRDATGEKPAHKTGLIGTIEFQEKEKKKMKDQWATGHVSQDGMMVQAEIARRQQEATRQAQQYGRTTPSPRAMSQASFPQQSYFPAQPPPPPVHQQFPQQYPQPNPQFGMVQSQYGHQQMGNPHVLRDLHSRSPQPSMSQAMSQASNPHVIRNRSQTPPPFLSGPHVVRKPSPMAQQQQQQYQQQQQQSDWGQSGPHVLRKQPSQQPPPPPSMQYYTPQQMGFGQAKKRNSYYG